jgi:hypothetical protein
MSYDQHMIFLASEYYAEPDQEPVTFDDATAGLNTNEAWVGVISNGLLSNGLFSEAVDDLATRTTLPEPTLELAKSFINELDWLVGQAVAMFEGKRPDEPKSQDLRVLAKRYEAGLGAVLSMWLDADGDWPSDYKQQEARHSD